MLRRGAESLGEMVDLVVARCSADRGCACADPILIAFVMEQRASPVEQDGCEAVLSTSMCDLR
jgi:hypothetical protein